jgi:hypothetical protein
MSWRDLAARAFAPRRMRAQSRSPWLVQTGGEWHRIVAIDLGAELAHTACGQLVPRGCASATAIGEATCPRCNPRRQS